MTDPRIAKLANNLVNYSCEIKKGERVLIENTGIQPDFVIALCQEIRKAGGQPFVQLTDPRVLREQILSADEDMLKAWAKLDAERMSQMQAYIGIRASDNSYELSGISPELMGQYRKLYAHPVHSVVRVPKTRWVVLRYPNSAMASQAGMATSDFEEFYFNVCNLDYAKMSAAMDSLVRRMESADVVHIVGPETDLTFSIKGLPAIKCDGKLNIPDGEVFSAPVRGSINGTLRINAPSLYEGTTFENIHLTFKDGKLTNATSSDTARMNSILDTDEGARGVGEFAIGVNPYIDRPMKDTLFDEKIAGSFHFTPGNCYDECDNGNKSAIHWDLVCIQTPEYGGGEMYFDGQLIRKDGLFVADDLLCLNPDNLK
ncbi:MAG: aminopeptidase [Oscillospiraceae bacterium]|jgi:aminopeptidase|nr:aminopeptidase [Oscillospiraceae bacterium]